MPYPNDSRLNVIISQTSASADSSGKFPFTERIISGSNLFLVTDASGTLTGSTSIPGGSFTNLTITGALTASFISASTAITSAAATFTGPVTMSSTLSASNISASNQFIAGNLTALGNTTLGNASNDVVSITGSTVISGSLTVVGNIAGTIDSASAISITDTPTTAGTYYVTFVDGTSGVRALRTDSSTLTWNPNTNTISSSGNLYVGGGIIDTVATSATLFGSATGITIGGWNTPLTTFKGDIKIESGLIKGSDGASGLQVQSYGLQIYGNAISSSAGTSNIILATNQDITASRSVKVAGTTQATSWNNGALVVDGGVGIGKNLYVSGSTFLYGDLTIFGTGSVVNISSSNVIIGDNRIVLNAGTPVQRYAGLDVYDSGSGTYINNITSSLLWDGLTDNWVIFSANSSSGTFTTASSVVIGGPVSQFGSEGTLTSNVIPKVQSTGKNLQNSLLSDNGTTLAYAGTAISTSQVTASQLTVQYTGSVTYATGVYITYTTGSFTTITITTGSSPGVGAQVPASPTAAGLAGQINVDNNFIYVYTNQVWKRVPLSTWLP